MARINEDETPEERAAKARTISESEPDSSSSEQSNGISVSSAASELGPISSTPSQTPSSGASTPTSNEPMDFDLPCIKCQYNLRSLARDAACPECGSSVANSVLPWRMMFTDPAWLKKVRLGIMLGLVAYLWTIFFNICLPILISYLDLDLHMISVVYAIAVTPFLGLTAAAAFLMTFAEPGQPDEARPHWAHWTGMLSAVLLIFIVYSMIGILWAADHYELYMSAAYQYITQATFLVLFVNIAGLCGSLAMVVRRYAQRMNRKRLAVFSLVFAVLMVIEVLLWSGVMIMSIVINSADYGFEYRTVMIVAALVVYGLTFILFIYLLVLMILHLLAMGRTIKDAGQVGSAGRSWSRKE